MNPTRASARKVKRSFSISPESHAFIRRVQKERRTRSASETLDSLLSELMAIRQHRRLETAWKDYYDALGDAEAEEHNTWGAFAESQLAEEFRRP